MRLFAVMAAAALGLGGAAPAAAGHWTNAIEVPGTGALNQGAFQFAEMTSISCASGGDCAAGGFYSDRTDHTQAFVASQRNDRWSTAIEVPGTASLNKKNAAVASVSCGSAGNCAAGGTFEGSHFGTHAFVVTQRDGRWGKAVEIPDPAPARAAFAEVTSVSCPPKGGCVAGGDYVIKGVRQPFAVAERDGRWEKAVTLPGIAKLSVTRFALLNSMSCSSAGNCIAAGDYAPSQDLGEPYGNQVFTATERNGRWGDARQIHAPASRIAGEADFSSLSCPSAGNCTLAGSYHNSSGASPAFVISERNGRWGKSIAISGIGIESLSCPTPGNCAASGSISTNPQESQALLVTERNGRWGKAFAVPGIAPLDTGDDADATAVSCWSAGNCVAGGTYTNQVSSQAFVVTDSNGRWGNAFAVPGSERLNSGRNATITVLSCTAGGECGAGGDYAAQAGSGQNGEVFVATRT